MSTAKDAGFNQLLNHAAKNYVDSQDEKNKSAELKLTLAIVGILAFVGYEAVKVIFRKNFGMTRGSLIRLLLCFLCFISIGAISFANVNSSDNFATASGSSDSHLVMGILYSVLAFVILIKGFTKRNKQDLHYEGDSILLSFLMKDGWNQRNVQNLAEPLLVLALGIACCFFDLLGGIPMIFCALSVWANLLFDILFSKHSLQDNLQTLNTDSNDKKDFHIINSE